MPEFTVIPVFAQFLNGFTIEESLDMGAASDLALTCARCFAEVVAITDELDLHQLVQTALDHECD